MPRVTRDVLLPSDPGVTVTLRSLSWLQAREARSISQRDSMKALREMGGMTALKELQGDGPEAPKADPDPFLTHDPLTVLVGGCQSWTRPEPLDRAAVEDLDEGDAEYLARQILALGKRPSASETERKNADSPSTAA